MSKRNIIYITLLVLSAVFYSCYYNYGIDTSNLDLVGTYYDNTYDFSTVHTYFMPDSIVHSTNGSFSGQYDAQVLSRVAANLDALGWTRKFPGGSDTADVMVFLGSTTAQQDVTFYNDWWSYWGWYGGWGYYPTYGYGSGWGWYYPSSYAYTSYTYYTGTVLITLTDARKGGVNGSTSLGVQWFAAINGVLDGVNISGRIDQGINQAFIQSPYLK